MWRNKWTGGPRYFDDVMHTGLEEKCCYGQSLGNWAENKIGMRQKTKVNAFSVAVLISSKVVVEV
jgi:hypothetical protein